MKTRVASEPLIIYGVAMIRKGREFYSKNYEKAIELYNKGLPIKDVAEKMGISYSCAYHWIKGLRKPEKGNLNEFIEFLKKNGPTAAIDAKERFPKHNELFLMASRRGMGVQRCVLKRKFGEYSTWYYLKGQEQELRNSLEELFGKVQELRDMLREVLGLPG